MKTSKQLWNERAALVQAMNEAVVADNLDEARRLEGEIRALDRQIEDTVNFEDEERARAATNPVDGEKASIGEKLFGPKASFRGIEPGFKATFNPKDGVSGLDTPQIYKYDLPSPVEPIANFLATLPKGKTNGDEHYFMRPVFTNNAATWTQGNKPESAIEWTEDTAHIEVIAHQMPILKQTARRYGQLENIVSGSLMMGLDMVCDEKALRGDNENGIVGVTNRDGVLLHTLIEGENIVDTVLHMALKVRIASHLLPKYVCLSPRAAFLVLQIKDKNDRKIYSSLAEAFPGMTVVEDENMTTADGKESVLVYNTTGTRWDVADEGSVEIGLVDKQFIQNAYTMLAETSAALPMEIPSAFCYCGDLGIAADAVDSE